MYFVEIVPNKAQRTKHKVLTGNSTLQTLCLTAPEPSTILRPQELLPTQTRLVNMTTPRTNFIGINVSGEHVRAALVDEHGSILESRIGGIATELIPQLAAIVEDLRQTSGPVSARLESRFRVW